MRGIGDEVVLGPQGAGQLQGGGLLAGVGVADAGQDAAGSDGDGGADQGDATEQRQQDKPGEVGLAIDPLERRLGQDLTLVVDLLGRSLQLGETTQALVVA